MRLSLIGLILLLSVVPSFAALAGRTNLGLYGGQIEALATFDMPGTPNRVYADVRGSNALYFTDDVGLTWNLAISGNETSGLATDSTYVYVVVNGMEIWRSDGADGLTWTKILGPSFAVYSGEFLATIVHDGTRLLVGASSGVLYSNPTGNPADWVRNVVSATATPDEAVLDVTSRPTDPNTFLAVIQNHMFPQAAYNQLYESTDSGVTWSSVSLPATITTAVEVVGVDPAHPDDVYLGGDSANATIYLNRNYLDPALWNDITPGSFQSRYPQFVRFHQGLTWTTTNVYNVTTGIWTQLPNTTVGTHLNDGALAFDPDDPAIVFSASDVGVAVSMDSAVTFVERNTNIEAVEIFDVDVDSLTKDVAVVASKSGLAITTVFQKPPVPADWNFPVFPHGNGGPPMKAVALVQGSTLEIVAGDNSETIFLSEDGGATWREVYSWLASPIVDRSSVNDIDSAVGSNVLFGAIGFWELGNDGVVVQSGDRGKTWTQTTLTGVHPNTLEIVGTNRVYVGVGNERDVSSLTNKGIYVTNDGGVTWNQVMVGTAPLNAIVTDLAQDPVNPLIQYASIMTGPGTGTVMRIEYDATGLNVLSAVDLIAAYGGPMFGNFTAVETDNVGLQLFAGINEDVFRYDVTAHTWSVFSTGLRGETVYCLYWDALVAGTSTGFYSYTESSFVPEWVEY